MKKTVAIVLLLTFLISTLAPIPVQAALSTYDETASTYVFTDMLDFAPAVTLNYSAGVLHPYQDYLVNRSALQDFYLMTSSQFLYSDTSMTYMFYLDNDNNTAVTIPVEFNIPDYIANITVYAQYNSSDYKLYQWALDNATTNGQVFFGNLIYVNGSYLGELVDSPNFGGLVLGANTTLTAGTYGQHLVNFSAYDLTVTRLGIPADYSTDKIQYWNPENSRLYGNPWVFTDAAPTAAIAKGAVGMLYVNAGTTVVLHDNTTYADTARAYLESADNSKVQWTHTTGSNTYTLEFVVDNDNAANQTTHIEYYLPDNTADIIWSYWNGSAYVAFARSSGDTVTSIDYPVTVGGATCEAAIYPMGSRAESWAELNATVGWPTGNVTYSSLYGCINRGALGIEMRVNDGDAAGPDGDDEIKLKLQVLYSGDGSTTYQFEPTPGVTGAYGLNDTSSNTLLAYSASGVPAEYMALILEQKPVALWVTADENETLTYIEFNNTAGSDYKILTDTTRIPGETVTIGADTVSRLMQSWRYMNDFAYFDRGEENETDTEGHGDINYAYTYGLDQISKYRACFKVHLLADDNDTAGPDGADEVLLKIVMQLDPAYTEKYTYLCDMSFGGDLEYLTSHLLSYENNYTMKVEPDLPLKNATSIDFELYNTTFAMNASAQGNVTARLQTQYLTLDGSRVNSKYLPTEYLNNSAHNITLVAGYPSSFLVSDLKGANLTRVAHDSDTLNVTVSGAGRMTVDTTSPGRPTYVLNTPYASAATYSVFNLVNQTVVLDWSDFEDNRITNSTQTLTAASYNSDTNVLSYTSSGASVVKTHTPFGTPVAVLIDSVRYTNPENNYAGFAAAGYNTWYMDQEDNCLYMRTTGSTVQVDWSGITTPASPPSGSGAPTGGASPLDVSGEGGATGPYGISYMWWAVIVIAAAAMIYLVFIKP